MVLQKQDGGIRPILCGEIWRRCFASLAVNSTPVRNEAAGLFTSTYDNFIQTAGIRDSNILILIFCSVIVAYILLGNPATATCRLKNC
jgi:hypothetical protein